jgi:hypothetical protein
MKLQLISENDLTKAAWKLNQQVVKTGAADLQGLVIDPNATVQLIRRGMTAPEFVLADKWWIEEFLEQWRLLDENTIEQIFDNVYQEVTDKISKIRNQSESILIGDDILSEGALSSVGGFLSKLAKFAMLLMKLLIASGGGSRNLNPKSLAELRVFNPYSVYRLTHDLQVASQHVLKQQRKPKRVKI